jgi:hypothetical protein
MEKKIRMMKDNKGVGVLRCNRKYSFMQQEMIKLAMRCWEQWWVNYGCNKLFWGDELMMGLMEVIERC